jgi:hypothetical protein
LVLFAGAVFREALHPGQVLLPGESLFGFPPWAAYPSPGPWIEFDLPLMFYPWQVHARRCFDQGVAPLWNPYIFCGAPFLGASQPAVFHPLNLLSQILSPARAFSFLLPARTLWAALGAACLVLFLGGSAAGAVVGGLSFGFAGGMIHFAGKSNPLVIGMLPWLVLAVEGVARRPGPRRGALLGLALGTMFLGGHVESAYYVFLFALTHLVWAGLRQATSSRARRLRWLGFGLLVGALLPAIQGLPFLEYMAHSVALEDRLRGIGRLPGMPPGRLVQLIFPDLFGDPHQGTFAPGRIAYNELTSASIGLVAVCLAAAAWRSRSERGLLWFLWIWAGLALVGSYEVPPVSGWLRSLPGFSLAYNIRMVLILHFSLAILAGLGCTALGRALHGGPRQNRALAALFRLGLLLGLFDASLGLPGVRDAVGLPRAGAVSVVGGTAMILLGLLFEASRRSSWPSRLLAWSAAAAVAASIYPFARRANDAVPAERLYPPVAGWRTLLQERDDGHRFAGLGRAVFPNAAVGGGLLDVRGYDSLVPRRTMRLLELLDPGVRNRPLDHVCQFVLLGRLRAPLLDLLGVRTLIYPPENREAALRFAEEQGYRLIHDGDSVILRNPRGRGLARLVGVTQALDQASVLGALARPEYRADLAVTPDLADATPPAGRVLSLTRRTAQWMEIMVELEEPGLLRVAESNMPGWRAFVDGAATSWLPVDLAFIGVPLPAGRHRVELRYAPDSFRLGAFLTLTALLLAASAAAGGWRSNHV